MIKSAQAVKDRLKNIVSDKNIDFNSAMRFFMYDRFIDRLAKSKYKDNFILKGGFYLSTLFGLNNRSTMDIDTAIREAELSEDNVRKMIEEIISVDVDDNVEFKINKIEPIRDEDEYGGYRVTLDFKLDYINDKFHIDVATGDPIHPGPVNYGYSSMLEKDTYNVWSYSIETILAEKIETILRLLETSSRMKDYYDVYLLRKFEFTNLNQDNFRRAVDKTFQKRAFNSDIAECLDVIRNSEILKKRWAAYAKKNSFAKHLEFITTVEALEDFTSLIVPVNV